MLVQVIAQLAVAMLRACARQKEYQSAHQLLLLTGTYYTTTTTKSERQHPHQQHHLYQHHDHEETEFLSSRIKIHPLYMELPLWECVLRERLIERRRLARDSDGVGDSGNSVGGGNARGEGAPHAGLCPDAARDNDHHDAVVQQLTPLLYEMKATGVSTQQAAQMVGHVTLAYTLNEAQQRALHALVRAVWQHVEDQSTKDPSHDHIDDCRANSDDLGEGGSVLPTSALHANEPPMVTLHGSDEHDDNTDGPTDASKQHPARLAPRVIEDFSPCFPGSLSDVVCAVRGESVSGLSPTEAVRHIEQAIEHGSPPLTLQFRKRVSLCGPGASSPPSSPLSSKDGTGALSASSSTSTSQEFGEMYEVCLGDGNKRLGLTLCAERRVHDSGHDTGQLPPQSSRALIVCSLELEGSDENLPPHRANVSVSPDRLRVSSIFSGLVHLHRAPSPLPDTSSPAMLAGTPASPASPAPSSSAATPISVPAATPISAPAPAFASTSTLTSGCSSAPGSMPFVASSSSSDEHHTNAPSHHHHVLQSGGPVLCLSCCGNRAVSGGMDARVQLHDLSMYRAHTQGSQGPGQGFGRSPQSVPDNSGGGGGGSGNGSSSGGGGGGASATSATFSSSISSITLPGHTAAVTCVALSGCDGSAGHGTTRPPAYAASSTKPKFVVSGSLDSTLRVWMLPQDGSFPTATSPSPRKFSAGGLIARLGGSGNKAMPPARVLSGHTGAVLCVEILEAASTVTVIASGGADGIVRLWEPQSSSSVCVAIAELCGHKGAVSCLHSTGREIISGSHDRNVHLWDPERPGPSPAAHGPGGADEGAGGPLAVLRGHTGTIRRVQFKAAHLAVSSSNDRALRLWDRRATGDAAIVVIDGHVAPLTCFSTSRGANPTIVTGAADGAVKVWDLRSHSRPVHELAGHAGAVSALHCDRCDLLSAGADGIVREHNMGTGELVHEHTGHSGAITAMARSTFAILTASWDHSVRLWARRPIIGESVIGV